MKEAKPEHISEVVNAYPLDQEVSGCYWTIQKNRNGRIIFSHGKKGSQEGIIQLALNIKFSNFRSILDRDLQLKVKETRVSSPFTPDYEHPIGYVESATILEPTKNMSS